MVNWSELPAEILLLAADKLNLAAVWALTVTVIELVDKPVESVVLMVAVWASYKVIKPPEVETPLLNVITSEVKKVTAVLLLLLTVGVLEFGEALALLKVKVMLPL